MRSTSVLLVVVSCFVSSIGQARASLPPILNSYPKCHYKVLEQADVSDKAIVRHDDVETAKQTLLDNALYKVRQRASANGADAIILTEVQGSMGNSQSIRTLRHPGYEISYKIKAEFIAVCQDDNTLSTVYTPYNNSGGRQGQIQQPLVATNLQFEIAIPATALQINNEQPPLANTISLQHGFYGAKIGMTPEQIQTLFGLPDAELTLKNDDRAWIYGQEHQLIFAGNTLIAISQTNNILSAEIKKQLVENLRFQQQDWIVDKKFSRRTALAEIKAFYQDRLKPLDQQRFALKNDHSQLTFHFAPYLNVKNNSNQLLLVNVSLTSRQFVADKVQLKLPEPDSLLALKSRLTILATSAAEGPFAIPEMAFFNRSQLRDGNQLAVLNPSLAVSYHDGHIVGLTITNIVNDYAVSDIQQQLALLHLPATKAEFMARFPEAFDSLEQLTLYGDHSEIKATYNRAELIDSLHIAWY